MHQMCRRPHLTLAHRFLPTMLMIGFLSCQKAGSSILQLSKKEAIAHGPALNWVSSGYPNGQYVPCVLLILGNRSQTQSGLVQFLQPNRENQEDLNACNESSMDRDLCNGCILPPFSHIYF
jgi:hypothetical protein